MLQKILEKAIPASTPVLDPAYRPAVLWNKAYREEVAATGKGEKLVICLKRNNGAISRLDTEVFPHEGDFQAANIKYVERLVKFMLWMNGGQVVTIGGHKEICDTVAAIYSDTGKQSFDNDLIGRKVYGKDLEFVSCTAEEAPAKSEITVHLGRNLDGARLGFDLGGSDRKAGIVVDGKVLFTEEIEWDPYFQEDPEYHLQGIKDTLDRAISHLPEGRKLDAIGGSAAGVYVDNLVRAASLFRGVSKANGDSLPDCVTNIFEILKKEYDVPFIVVNDGEVTALAGSMSINDNAVLGLSLGTSFAAGYVTPEGTITDWLNELAFVPIDYREDGPVDEWSQDEGCGVQYFSQQGVARLIPAAGIEVPEGMPFPEQLIEVQKLMAEGDERAAKIYETIGTCFGYTIAQFAEFYEIRNLLILGRVTSGKGGNMILDIAEEVLKKEFPALAAQISFRTPDEQNKRHGQAVAAASLPELG